MRHIIDLRGICCPMNFVRAKLAIEELQGGEEVELLLDPGEPVKNLPRSLKEEGHTLLGLREGGEGHYILELETAKV